MEKRSLEESINFYSGGRTHELLLECIKKEKEEIIIDWEKIKQQDLADNFDGKFTS